MLLPSAVLEGLSGSRVAGSVVKPYLNSVKALFAFSREHAETSNNINPNIKKHLKFLFFFIIF
jgi:hypothetical protein